MLVGIVTFGRGKEAMRCAIYLAALAWVAIFMTADPSVAIAAAQTDDYWTDFISRSSRDLDAISEFNRLTNQDDVSRYELVSRAESLIEQLDESLAFYRKPHPVLGSVEYMSAADKLVEGIDVYNSGLKKYHDALNEYNYAGVSAVVVEMNDGIDSIKTALQTIRDENQRIQSSVKDENRRVENTVKDDERQIRQLVVWGTISSAGITIILLALSLRKSRYRTELIRIELYRRMFRTSLVPTGGLTISLVTYLAAKGGGTYYIATGAILFGGLGLLRQLHAYFTELKPSLDVFVGAEKLFVDHYDDLLKLYSSIPAEEFERTLAKNYRVNLRVAQFVGDQLREFVAQARAEEQRDAYDPYAVLGVSRGDSMARIKEQYRELAKRYHPDVSGSDTAEQFMQITNAYTSILRERGISR